MNKRVIQVSVGLVAVGAACSAQVPTTTAPIHLRATTTTGTATAPASQPFPIPPATNTSGTNTSGTTAPVSTSPTTVAVTTTAPTVRKAPVPPPPPPAEVVHRTPSTTQAVEVPVVVGPPPPPVLPSEPLDPAIKGRMAYLAGQRLRDLFQQTGTNTDDYAVVAEFLKGLQGGESSFSQERMDQAVAQLQARVRQRQAEKQFADDPAFRKVAEENTQRSRSEVELLSQTAGYDTAADGVLLRVDKPGGGRFVANAKTVTMAIRLSMADGTQVSSTGPVKAAIVDLLPAVADVCRTMRVGSKFRVVLPADKAYGLAGRPPVIGPNRAVVFDLDLTAAE